MQVPVEDTWTETTGTYDPVGAGATLAQLSQGSEPEAEGDGQVDALAEYMSRETAYLEASPAPN